ncbi:uncharacterized protein V1513DRAFT_456367 [Lipomyces chichibuensis]|uniref:uncharacterized protein n=1 Tax=Lipomyces chichibuensis TaxID=1546026 RepID=UPI00334333C4
MSVIGVLTILSPLHVALRPCVIQPARKTSEISSQPATKRSKRTVHKSVLTTRTRVAAFHKCSPMEQSVLMGVVRRPLSPDAKIEVPASWDEYEYAQELLETEGNKYPRLCYDSTRQIAIVVAAPTPLHGDMVGELVGSLAHSCNDVLLRGGISADIRRRVRQATDITKTSRAGRGLTIREWDGALRYLVNDDDEKNLMVAFEVGVSQSYRSLQEAISWCVCALHCRLGIAMCLNEGPRGAKSDVQYFANEEEAAAAIQQARNELRHQLRQNPFGPLVRDGITWFGKLEKVVIEAFRCEDANCRPGTLLYPTRSFVVIRDGQSSPEDIPPNLGEVVLGDCVPSHVLNGHEILATPIDFFQKSWVEANIRSAILETAVERVKNKFLVLESTGC